MNKPQRYDVAIIGGGPAGAASALYLLEAGLKPIIIEKEAFPRYHIGESLTGECGARLRELGLEEKIIAANYPIKYGVSVYGAQGKNAFWIPVQKRDAESVLQDASTWQVRRDEFDKMLLDTALERGAAHCYGEALTPLLQADRINGLRYRTAEGRNLDLAADVVIDASGQATFFASKSALTSGKNYGRYNRQIAIFTKIRGTVRDPGAAAGNTIIFYQQKNHWAWFIPLDDDVVSIGVVVPADYFKSSGCSTEAFLKKELHSLNPELTKRLPALDFVHPVHTISNYSYHVQHFVGDGFLCVGDAHRFIDPIFSFGVHFAISEAQFAAQAIKAYLGKSQHDDLHPFVAYQNLVEQGQNIIQDLLDCFWEFPLAFLYFVHHQYRSTMIDIFAGRIYNQSIEESAGRKAIRQLLTTMANETPSMAAA